MTTERLPSKPPGGRSSGSTSDCFRAPLACSSELSLERELDGLVAPEAAEGRQVAAAAGHTRETLGRLVASPAGEGDLPGELALGVTGLEAEYALVLELLAGAAVEPGCARGFGTEAEAKGDEGNDNAARRQDPRRGANPWSWA